MGIYNFSRRPIMKCRVWYIVDIQGNPTGEVSVSYPDVRPHKKPEGLTMEQWNDKQLEDVRKRPQFQGLAYDDMDSSQIPVRDKDRDRWRSKKGEKIKVDTTVRLRQDVLDDLDAELAKPNADTVKLMRLQRKLDKKDYTL